MVNRNAATENQTVALNTQLPTNHSVLSHSAVSSHEDINLNINISLSPVCLSGMSCVSVPFFIPLTNQRGKIYFEKKFFLL